MKYAIFMFALAATLFSGGCRREDIREMTVSMPSLKETDKQTVYKVLSRYQGVLKDSFVWDLQAKTLTLSYDSMKVAQANIRYAIDEAGIKVSFPVKTTDRAGY